VTGGTGDGRHVCHGENGAGENCSTVVSPSQPPAVFCTCATGSRVRLRRGRKDPVSGSTGDPGDWCRGPGWPGRPRVPKGDTGQLVRWLGPVPLVPLGSRPGGPALPRATRLLRRYQVTGPRVRRTAGSDRTKVHWSPGSQGVRSRAIWLTSMVTSRSRYAAVREDDLVLCPASSSDRHLGRFLCSGCSDGVVPEFGRQGLDGHAVER
jgi:hypothetical protein